MKVVAFNGSPRRDGNTAALIGHVLRELEKEGIKTELVQIGGNAVHGCKACGSCFEAQGRCAIDKDIMNQCIGKMQEADGIILGSPTYFGDVTPEIKALIDRAGMVAKAGDDMLRRKVGAGVVAVRRAGAIHAFDTINHFFLISQMIVIGSSYWNIGIGLEKGAVEEDREGVGTMWTLGKNMAWTIKRLKG